jgi:hypothetical protein
VKGDHLARLGIHGDPNPLLVFLLLHKALHFVGFHLKTLNHDILGTTDRFDVEMIRQRLKTLDQKAHQPLECDTYSATDAAQRYPLHQ